MTAMMLLTANNMHKPQYAKLSFDNQLVDAGLQSLDKMVEETQSEALRSFHERCAELHQHAQQRRGPVIMTVNNHDLLSHFPEFD